MKIVIIENSSQDFFKSRIRLANFLKEKGCTVTAIVPNDGFVDEIKDCGVDLFVVGKNIRGKGIINQLKFAIDIYKILKTNDFDIVHCFRMQPNIIGGFIGGILSLNVYNHITGLGILFTKNSFRYRLQNRFIKFCYKFNSNVFKTKFIFQNKEDVVELGIKQRFKIIRGSSVNEDLFFPKKIVKSNFFQKLSIDAGKITVLFVSRLIKSKGLGVLVNALKIANKSFDNNFQLIVVGWIDKQNLDSHTPNEIDLFNKNDFVHFLGERKDISDLINASDICVLPSSYREGIPRFLLEAMACSKPIITTNMPGCNLLIDRKNENGILIEKNDYLALSDAFIQLSNSDLVALGKNSLKLYKRNFSEEIVHSSIYNYYKFK